LLSRPSNGAALPPVLVRQEGALFGTTPETLGEALGRLGDALSAPSPVALAALLRPGSALHTSPGFFSFRRALYGEPAAPVVLCAIGAALLGGAVVDSPARALLWLRGETFDLARGGAAVDWRAQHRDATGGGEPPDSPRLLTPEETAERIRGGLRHGAAGRGDAALLTLLDALETEAP
jgi:hypothetical protein